MPPGRKPPLTRGRRSRFVVPPRRFIVVFVLAIILSIAFLATSQTPAPAPAAQIPTSLSEAAGDLFSLQKLPKIYNVFGESAHEPPKQADSHSGETKWYSDLKWLQNPFSSAVTLDENRALLPPLPRRTIVYTFYDSTAQKDERAVEEEHKILLAWRRAWWAQGFKPIVLGRPEAARHALYKNLKGLSLEASLAADVERWLAWAHVGGGILVNWLVFPMAAHDDLTLTALREEHDGRLMIYKNLQSAVLVGHVDHINRAVEQALSSEAFKTSASVFAAVPSKTFTVIAIQEGLALYDVTTINAHYKVVANQLDSSMPAGLRLLRQLINAHLHVTWQNNFPGGVAVLQPYARQTTVMVEYASQLGHDLIACPTSPMPASCPPNRPSCKTCESSRSRLALTTPTAYSNKSSVFTVGTVPHPYTFTSLFYQKEQLETAFIRRETKRDMWLVGITMEILGPVLGGPQRLPSIKQAVADTYATGHSVWITAELEEQMDRNWVFGFELPNGEQSDKAQGADQQAKAAAKAKEPPSETEGAATEQELLEKCKQMLKQKKTPAVEMVEAWNMADAEAWRFARAFATRRRLERIKWEEEERKFAGAEVRERGWGAWLLG